MSAGGVVGIHAIGGMAGVGKTTFAVHAGRPGWLWEIFPGGQIFLLLHGHTPGGQPVDPAEALAQPAADDRSSRRPDPAEACGTHGAMAGPGSW